MNFYRSLKLRWLPYENYFKILERLAEGGFLQNNRQLNTTLHCSINSRFVKMLCSMKNLDTLRLFDYKLTPDVLAHVIQSCPKLINLQIGAHDFKTFERAQHLKNQLRSGFQKIRYFELRCLIGKDSWLVIQEMLT
jgi:hypothetical protein